MNDKRRNEQVIEDLRRRRIKEAVVDVEERLMKVVVFTLCGGLYAFPGADVREILPMMEISPVPGAPDFIPGVINNRGDIESVISLNRFLGIPVSENTSGCRIAMVSKSGMRSGIFLDSVLDVTDVPVNSILPPLSTLDHNLKELIAGEMQYNGATVIMIDVATLFKKLVMNDE